MKALKPSGFLTAATIVLLLVSGCGGMRINTKSSVMDYLYPKGMENSVVATIPRLQLPIKVGLAFVPDSTRRGQGLGYGYISGGTFLESDKNDLLKIIAKNFKDMDFVDSIEIIPTDYLSAGGSFANLEQIKTMYGVDVMALVSFDQMQFTDEGMLSLSYLTIVGAFVVSGEKNDTNTMMDTVVYDIASKKMLFRAPGKSHIKGSSTPVNLSEELRKDSNKGFEAATEDMVKNLKHQLADFKERVKKDPDKAIISHKKGYGGAGSFDLSGLLVLLLISLGIALPSVQYRKHP